MKVFDCFIFFNEFELLELRLSVLNDCVDYFVIVETDRTFKGEKKAFNFQEKMQDFAVYSDKLIYVKVTDMPEFYQENGWELEFFQRNSILRGLKNCAADDLIILSDIDEIPNPNTVKSVVKNNFKINYWFAEHQFKKTLRRYLKWFFKIHFLSGGQLLKKYSLVCKQNLYYYYLNCQSKGEWYGSIFCLYENFKNPQKIRDSRFYIPRVADGGWHFSYLGGIERVIMKLKSINEGENADSTVSHIQYCLSNGIDLYGRSGAEYEYRFVNLNEVCIANIESFVDKYPFLYCSNF